MSLHSVLPGFFTRFIRNFLRCGLFGWCMEILFTALASLRRRDLRLKGTTSVWMFPIYGCAALLAPLSKLLKNTPLITRGLIYMGLIFSGEYISGKFLLRHKLCPWDYSNSPYHIGRVIRLDYAPNWFFAGLLFEKVLKLSRDETPKIPSRIHPKTH